MILDILSQAERYFALHPLFEQAFRYLQQHQNQPPVHGRYELAGQQLIAIVESAPGRGRDHSPLEAHRRYIDIQYTLHGDELIGWRNHSTCKEIKNGYDPARDIEFFNDTPHVWLPVQPHSFAVFFPNDAHAPLAGAGILNKIIMKVAV